MWVDISYMDPSGYKGYGVVFLSVVILINDFWNVLIELLNLGKKKQMIHQGKSRWHSSHVFHVLVY